MWTKLEKLAFGFFVLQILTNLLFLMFGSTRPLAQPQAEAKDPSKTAPTLATPGNSNLTVELVLAYDWSMYKYHGGNEENVSRYLETLLKSAAGLFEEPSLGLGKRINFIIVAVQRWFSVEEMKAYPQGGSRIFNRTGMNKTLMEFRALQEFTQHKHFDMALLFTRHNFSPILGQAFARGACTEYLNRAVISDHGLSSGKTIAHEIGHLLGMDHDDSPECFNRMGPEWWEGWRMMYSKNDSFMPLLNRVWSPLAFSWSSCSRKSFEQFLNEGQGHCIVDEEKDGRNIRCPSCSYLNKLKVEDGKFPAQTYTADEQCKLIPHELSHQGYQREKVTACDEPIKSCSFMSCKFNGTDGDCEMVEHHWADGTPCGTANKNDDDGNGFYSLARRFNYWLGNVEDDDQAASLKWCVKSECVYRDPERMARWEQTQSILMIKIYSFYLICFIVSKFE